MGVHEFESFQEKESGKVTINCSLLFCLLTFNSEYYMLIWDDADDGDGIDGLPTEGIEITCFNQVGLLCIAYKWTTL